MTDLHNPLHEYSIAAAADLLREGGLVAFPTETVYGLGSDATNDQAVAKVFAIKQRPQINPLIIHCYDIDMVQEYVCMDEQAKKLAKAFWPGPLTLVLPRKRGCSVSLLSSAGLDTLAVRIPNHPLALELLKATGRPLAAPSANKSGKISPTCAQHVEESFKNTSLMILDGGPCLVGIESSIIDLSLDTPVLLRPGGIASESLAKFIGSMAARSEHRRSSGIYTSPGQMKSHYAPTLPLRLKTTYVTHKEALLAFGKNEPQGAAFTLNLSPKGNLTEAAANLFAMLREVDQPDFSAIAVVPIPDHDLGAAINDRLNRAAAERPLR